MSVTLDILNQVKTVLSNDATLKAYVQRFELGARRNIAKSDYPIILIEPGTQTESYIAYPKVDGHFIVTVVGYTHVYDIEVQMTGDANYKGVLQMENDIKLALGAKYPTLNGTVIEFTFPRTEFGVRHDLAEFPVRGVAIDVDLHYRTQLDTRT